MKKRRFAAIAAGVLVLVLLSQAASAYVLVVNDPATTGKNIFTAIFQEMIRKVEVEKEAAIRRMARSLSIFVSLRRYVAENIPQWRTWRQYDPIPESLAWMEALNTGVGSVAVATVAPPRPPIDPELDLPDSLRQSLALLDLADSSLVAAVDQTGRIRGARRGERASFAALDDAVGILGGSASARADVLAAAALINAQQKQTRLELLAPIVEQLVVEALKARQVDTSTFRMRETARKAGRSLVEGAAADLHGWKQP